MHVDSESQFDQAQVLTDSQTELLCLKSSLIPLLLISALELQKMLNQGEIHTEDIQARIVNLVNELQELATV
jgi:hypothetical protein